MLTAQTSSALSANKPVMVLPRTPLSDHAEPFQCQKVPALAAQMSLAEVPCIAQTLVIKFGLWVQSVPFQCQAYVPANQTSLDDVPQTAWHATPPFGGKKVRVHAEPSQCRYQPYFPAAQTSFVPLDQMDWICPPSCVVT